MIPQEPRGQRVCCHSTRHHGQPFASFGSKVSSWQNRTILTTDWKDSYVDAPHILSVLEHFHLKEATAPTASATPVLGAIVK